MSYVTRSPSGAEVEVSFTIDVDIWVFTLKTSHDLMTGGFVVYDPALKAKEWRDLVDPDRRPGRVIISRPGDESLYAIIMDTPQGRIVKFKCQSIEGKTIGYCFATVSAAFLAKSLLPAVDEAVARGYM